MEHNMDTKKYDKEICNECNGCGFFMFLKARPTPNYWFHSCGQCHGTGQIDWIQKIVKRENITPVGHILEDFYFKETGNLVRDNREEIKMLSYCYSNVKVVKKD